MMLQITQSHIARIGQHARESYPNECCGFLLGKQGEALAEVAEVLPAVNTRTDAAHHRYNISPLEYLEVERRADRAGLSILGFYHSHPDHPAIPSAFDLEHAWPNVVYLILSVQHGKPAACRAYRLDEDRQRFHEIDISCSK